MIPSRKLSFIRYKYKIFRAFVYNYNFVIITERKAFKFDVTVALDFRDSIKILPHLGRVSKCLQFFGLRSWLPIVLIKCQSVVELEGEMKPQSLFQATLLYWGDWEYAYVRYVSECFIIFFQFVCTQRYLLVKKSFVMPYVWAIEGQKGKVI